MISNEPAGASPDAVNTAATGAPIDDIAVSGTPFGAAAYVASSHAASSHGASAEPAPAAATPAVPSSGPETATPHASLDAMALVPSHARDSHDGSMAPLRQAIVDALRSIYDPEIPVNIYDIGLIYEIDLQPEGRIDIRMTLTSPMCPVAESLPPEVQAKVAAVDGVADCNIDLVWEPAWTPAMMSEDARLLLNIM